ncbi:pilus assembly protein [Sphingomonas sp. NSE70-1]|uniref:Pilus assembly protein n=1 Tax=Sphingomonas caseinilyticus TaxID=2908205 RepID=A0ABT0RSP6_9SPHN|nr:TadE/TadG family type IV pilus assembly protein [Sphingomonas caseinilyticus]MCL6697976.1 pilus assembly protein [Sphingomonas caseinilyticus]
MKLLKRIKRDHSGAAVIEMAFALPALIVLIWMIVQLGLVLRAMSGIQHALGEGARLATIWPVPDVETIQDRMDEAVYGIGPGDFAIPPPVQGEADGSEYLDLEVTYVQETDLLLLPGPTISVSRSKRVWRAETEEESGT